MTYTDATDRLFANTKPKSHARALGERFLLRRSLTTAQIMDVDGYMCSSILERLRCDLRGRCGWHIEVESIEGQHSKRYTLQIEDAE